VQDKSCTPRTKWSALARASSRPISPWGVSARASSRPISPWGVSARATPTSVGQSTCAMRPVQDKSCTPRTKWSALARASSRPISPWGVSARASSRPISPWGVRARATPTSVGQSTCAMRPVQDKSCTPRTKWSATDFAVGGQRSRDLEVGGSVDVRNAPGAGQVLHPTNEVERDRFRRGGSALARRRDRFRRGGSALARPRGRWVSRRAQCARCRTSPAPHDRTST